MKVREKEVVSIDCNNKKHFVTVAQFAKYSLVGCVHPLKITL